MPGRGRRLGQDSQRGPAGLAAAGARPSPSRPPLSHSTLWQDKNSVEDGNLFFGVLFYSILYMLLGGISEMHLLVARLRCWRGAGSGRLP